jgi:heptose-I-phosphate ethanolaminephosphotransferase
MNNIYKALTLLLKPFVRQGTFFVTMYVLGVLCSVLTMPDGKGAHLYENLWLELFLDTYLATAVITLLPHKVGVWVRRLAYVVLYAVAIADVYCYWKFDSTLNPAMLLLVGETDSREAGEFLRSYLTPDVLFSPIGWIVVLIVVHAVWACRRSIVGWLSYRQRMRLKGRLMAWEEPMQRHANQLVASLVVFVLLIVAAVNSFSNKVGMTRLMTADNIGQVEHLLTYPDHGEMYLPIYRLAFSIYSNHLASQQITKCIASARKVTVDSCSFRSPTIVLIIGESYGKVHSQLYGYHLKTTPRQVRREETSLLTPFTDVVSCWNLTSFVFKNVFSLHVIGQKGEWCDYPLFPEVFRKAGYHVTFLTNQFLPQAKEAVYDFSGGFFLNNPTLSKAQFDTRNTELHRFDAGLLSDYDSLSKQWTEQEKAARSKNPHAKAQPRLIIFHLIGQHVNYRTRCPNDRRVFGPDAYEKSRPELPLKKRRILADYDNAVLYNDSIVDAVCHKFENKDAIVIYMPDHGEECYEPGRDFICRNHSSAIDWPLAHYEFEVPFWIWCSHRYAVRHPEVFKAIKDAHRKRFMTDALPHVLLWLAGIHTPYYHDSYNILSPNYDEMRPRILKNSTDYDKVREAARKAGDPTAR